ncbi:transcriptional regulator NrdR [Halobacteriovorax sp. GB3]|uniref:transcriptional regulator NrdR n=1 Tax=Halobacteriovorax sp. GB3 TaxID=2719615 RepID=UPI00235EB17A|nr:transcriptional regulator NrdR [Halobacteriovorax sp. GB3]MDD0853968.1 transcriptional regulator NrdR [Halobacteriovorax sp. GB3]
MHCPVCNAQDTKVIDSRLLLEGQTIRRRRKCCNCDNRFTTYEKIQIQMPEIVKNDGRRENYNREKILKGLKKACQKRPITTKQINSLIDTVEREIISKYPDEAPANQIGKLTMSKLYELDPVSYVRFASFYWNYKNIESFISSLQKDIASIETCDDKGCDRDQLQ